MSCHKCMDYKPGIGRKSFVCPECNQRWTLAGVAPGAYWEPAQVAEQEKARAQEIIDAFRKEEGA